MTIRVRVNLIIISLAIIIVIFAIGTGLFFVQGSLEKGIEKDMTVVANTADKLISTAISLLKADASMVAQHLLMASEEDFHKTLQWQTESYNNFIALTVFDRGGIVDSYSMSYPSATASEEFIDSEYMKRAFAGEAVISTTYINSNGELVFYICVPMRGRVLSATVPGMFFSNMLSNLTIWKTGNIFVVDAAGTVLANIRPDWVLERYNFIEKAKTDSLYERAGGMISQVIKGKPGIGRFDMEGSERMCVYTPVTGSLVGWMLGVVAPLEESPLKNVRDGLLLVGVVCVLLSVVAAFFASAAIEQPYIKISELVTTLKARDEYLVAAREEALAGTAAKSDFLANMSHEMRTPLNAIIGFSELTLDAPDVGKNARESLEKIYNSGVTLLSLINDILDISKIESGKFELIPVEYDTPSLINDTVTLNIVRIGSKPITFHLHVDEAMPCRLFGDELRVKQIFNNLLSNAFKYTREGRVDWTISCVRDGDSVWLVSSVSDTGIGMHPEDIEKIFSEYNQVDTRSNRKIEGTGLGLSITRKMAELMGGSIQVESEYGKGSVFTVRIRQGFAGDVPIGAEVAENLKSFSYSDQRRDRSAKLVRARIPYAAVLVVDDVQTNLDVARGMMKPYGMQIDCVTSGQAAIEAIRNGNVKYNAVFMDHMMPGMDGIEAMRIIREIGTEYARAVPIIALTANAIIGNEDMFLQKGFQAFLSKPIDIMRMDFVINHWVRDKELEKRLSEEGGPDAQADADRRRGDRRRGDRRDGDRRGDADRRPNSGGGDTDLDVPDILNIKGIDAKQGLRRFSDDREIYLGVLRSYAQNTPPLLEQLRGDCTKEGLPNYAIVVHGIKSSSHSIGAERIGYSAEALEHAAKSGDFASVIRENDGFIEDVQALLKDLSSALRDIAEENPRPKKSEPDADVLADLLKACKSFDIDEVDKAMKELESYEYETGGELVEWLRAQASVTGFGKIAERLSQQ